MPASQSSWRLAMAMVTTKAEARMNDDNADAYLKLVVPLSCQRRAFAWMHVHGPCSVSFFKFFACMHTDKLGMLTYVQNLRCTLVVHTTFF